MGKVSIKETRPKAIFLAIIKILPCSEIWSTIANKNMIKNCKLKKQVGVEQENPMRVDSSRWGSSMAAIKPNRIIILAACKIWWTQPRNLLARIAICWTHPIQEQMWHRHPQTLTSRSRWDHQKKERSSKASVAEMIRRFTGSLP